MFDYSIIIEETNFYESIQKMLTGRKKHFTAKQTQNTFFSIFFVFKFFLFSCFGDMSSEGKF